VLDLVVPRPGGAVPPGGDVSSRDHESDSIVTFSASFRRFEIGARSVGKSGRRALTTEPRASPLGHQGRFAGEKRAAELAPIGGLELRGRELRSDFGAGETFMARRRGSLRAMTPL
jgi:hypothetical protein